MMENTKLCYSTRALPERSDNSCRSAPTISLQVNEEESVDIDLNSGLPRLPVELPQDWTMDPPEYNIQGKRKLVVLNSLDSKKQTPETSSPPKLRPSERQFTVDKTNKFHRDKSRHTLPLKNRSRSVFIKLQLPNQRTPPLPHRNLSILGESDSNVKYHSIQTAPVIQNDSNSPYFLYDNIPPPRRASDCLSLRGEDRQRDLSSVPVDEVVTPQTLPDVNASGHPEWDTIGRRSSYMYLSDTEDDNQSLPSRRNSITTNFKADETYITPFAQILASLHHVRSQYLALLGLPPETRTAQTRLNSASAPSPTTNSPIKRFPDSMQRKVALQTLEELDWCLKTLETVDSAKSMGTMAQDKFRRIMSRELSNMSGKSRSHNNVAEWVQNFAGLDTNQNIVDRALDTMQDEKDKEDKFYLEEARLSVSGSVSHDVWSRLKADIQQPHHEVDYCVRVPLYGVSHPDLDKKAMREFMSKKITTWDVDTFHLDTISAGNPLISASYLVFKKRDLFSTFKISPHVFINFMTKIQSSYLPNPYHNKTHATDVLLACNYLLNSNTLEGVFTDLEVLAALVAAGIHDVEHPARTNQFLVNVQHDLAILYNDNSVLENHHLAVAFKTMQDKTCNFLENFDSDQRQAFRKMVIDMVLATDMSKHFQHLGELKTLLETNNVSNDGILVLDKYSDRTEVLQCMIHCADLSNPTKEASLAANWSYRIMEENFLQGDEEKALGIPLNPLGDREHVSVCKCQVTFIDFIVYPLWETWAELVYPAGQLMLNNIAKTREYWNTMIDPNSPPLSDDQDSSEDVDTTELCSVHECRRMSNGVHGNENPTQVIERATCILSNELESSTDSLPLLEIHPRRSSDELVLNPSPVSERRNSFKSMKGEALEEQS